MQVALFAVAQAAFASSLHGSGLQHTPLLGATNDVAAHAELSPLSVPSVHEAGTADVYAAVSPVGEGGWIFLGEVDKYTVAAGKRFAGVEVERSQEVGVDGAATTASMRVYVKGVKGEVVKVCAVKASALGNTMCNTVTFSEAGTVPTVFKSSSKQ